MVRISSPRIPPIDLDGLPEDMREKYDRGVQTLNIMRTLANHPDLLRRWGVFANHILLKATLDARTRELVILRIGWLCRSGYEWGQHVVIARASGVSDEEIRRVQEGPQASDWGDRDRLVLQAADDLHRDAHVSDQTWNVLRELLSVQELMDLVFTAGQYTLVSMALNSFGVQPEAELPRLEL